ncbi:anion permease, partial [Escherichia coli]|uniref:anion permease n=1 Tax=Escherichia coli TaxID=562 RepID=UPI0022834A45
LRTPEERWGCACCYQSPYGIPRQRQLTLLILDDTTQQQVKNLPPLFDSFPNDPSSRRIGGYLMWMMVVGTSISSSMFVTGAAPNVLGIEFVGKIAGVHISWMQWFLAFLPVGLLLLIIAPLISYYLYKPGVTHSSEVAAWADTALGEMGKLT